MKWVNEKETLFNFVYVENKSYEEIGRFYGCSSQNIRKVLKKLGFDLPKRRIINEKEHFNKGKGGHKCLNKNCNHIIYGNNKQKYCSIKCQREFQNEEKYKYYLCHQDEFVGKEITYNWLKKIFLEEQNHQCAICSQVDSWNNKSLHFVLDHIDGDATNNKRENLRLVCPNCDSQLDTYKARNIGKSTRKYKPFNLK